MRVIIKRKNKKREKARKIPICWLRVLSRTVYIPPAAGATFTPNE
jgi:hypothetical protein